MMLKSHLECYTIRVKGDIYWFRNKTRNEELRILFFSLLFTFFSSYFSPSQSADPSRISELWHRCIKEEIDARQDGKRCTTIHNNTPRLRLMIGTRVIIGLEFVPAFIHHPPPPSPLLPRVAIILSLTYYLSRRILLSHGKKRGFLLARRDATSHP